MIPEKYYKTLGLSSSASQDEIKKSFRKLAMKYHPDKNPDPDSTKRFIDIIEAYEIVTGQREIPTKRARKTPQQSPVRSEDDLKKDMEERLRKAKERFEQKKYEEFLEEEQYYRQITQGKPFRFFKGVMWAALISAFLITVDRIIPGKLEERYAISIDKGMGSGGMRFDRVSPVKLDNNETFWISVLNKNLILKNPSLQVERSWIFRDIKRIYIRNNEEMSAIVTDFSVFGTFPLIPLLFLIPFITFLIKGRSMMYSVLFHGTLYLVFPGIVLFYLLKLG